MHKYIHFIDQAGRAQAQMQKEASLSSEALKSIKNLPTLGGAGAGAVYGGVRGYQEAGEGQRGSGLVAGALTGGVGGAFLGGAGRLAYKNVAPGFKQYSKGNKALKAEMEAALGKDQAKFRLSDLNPFGKASKRKEFLAKKKEEFTKRRGLAVADKRGKAAMDAEDAILKDMGSYGEMIAGRRKLVGSAIGAGIGAGYGISQLKDAKNVAKETDEERMLRQYERQLDSRLKKKG